MIRPTPSTTILTEGGALVTTESKPSIAVVHFQALITAGPHRFGFANERELFDICWIILPIPPGEKVATLPRDTTNPVGVRHATGAHQRLQGTRQPTKSGASQTSDSAAAPGAAGVHPRLLLPKTEDPARPSPRTIGKTPPGEPLSDV